MLPGENRMNSMDAVTDMNYIGRGSGVSQCENLTMILSLVQSVATGASKMK